jgi:hypothetical protein
VALRACRGRKAGTKLLGDLRFEASLQFLRIGCVHYRGIEIHDACADEVLKLTVKVLHALGCASPHGLKQILARGIIYLHARLGTGIRFDHLDYRDSPPPVFARNKALRNDVAKASG